MIMILADNCIINLDEFAAIEIMECNKSADVNGFLVYVHLASGSKILIKHSWKTIEEAKEALKIMQKNFEETK